MGRLNKLAREAFPQIPAFPANGSISHFNPVYEGVILSETAGRLHPVVGSGQGINIDQIEGAAFDQAFDEGFDGKPLEWLLQEASKFKPPAKSHSFGTSPSKNRIESARQKRLVAAIENYMCQICGFRYAFKTRSGKNAYIIEVDHIVDKAVGGTEEIGNLWVLCPNCHKKKTRGAIKIDPATKRVLEFGKELTIKDHHLKYTTSLTMEEA